MTKPIEKQIMAKMEMTNKELLELVNVLNSFLALDQAYSKLVITVRKQGKILSKELEDYYEKLEDLRLEYASEDDKKNVIRDEKGQFSYTKEATKTLNNKHKELISTTRNPEIFLTEQNLVNLPEQFQMDITDLLKIEFPEPAI